MNETIVALSSGTMKAAIAIIRLSGSQSFEILSAIFSNQKQYEHQKIYYGYIMDQQEVVDEVMVSCFLAPHSFTCENMVEIIVMEIHILFNTSLLYASNMEHV